MTSFRPVALVITFAVALMVVPGSDAMAAKSVLATAKAVELGGRPVTITLKSSRLAAVGSKRFSLALRGLRSDNPPDVLVQVYVNLPEGTRPAATDARHVGTINFYSANPFNAPDRLHQSLDLTAALRDVKRRGQLTDRITITFLPEGTPSAGTKATLARVELVAE
jgi:hypothetical protein